MKGYKMGCKLKWSVKEGNTCIKDKDEDKKKGR